MFESTSVAKKAEGRTMTMHVANLIRVYGIIRRERTKSAEGSVGRKISDFRWLLSGWRTSLPGTKVRSWHFGE